MNTWRCSHWNCAVAVVGCGSPIGLRAIGWYVQILDPTPLLLCPPHRPDPIACEEIEAHSLDGLDPCAMCAADKEADEIQSAFVFSDLTEEELAKRLYDIYNAEIAKVTNQPLYSYTPPGWEDQVTRDAPTAAGFRAIVREISRRTSRS